GIRRPAARFSGVVNMTESSAKSAASAASSAVQREIKSQELLGDDIAMHLAESAILLDIDGTLLDLAPTPREVWVPQGLTTTLRTLHQRTAGALALVSGRSINDIDLIFAPDAFP